MVKTSVTLVHTLVVVNPPRARQVPASKLLTAAPVRVTVLFPFDNAGTLPVQGLKEPALQAPFIISKPFSLLPYLNPNAWQPPVVGVTDTVAAPEPSAVPPNVVTEPY